MKVRVEASARLHLGMLDLNGELGRQFGSLGVCIEQPRTLVEASPAARLVIEGRERERAQALARRFLDAFQIAGSAYIVVREAIPDHVGLGSGTQLALAIGMALARLYGLQVNARELALALGRGGRSGIGIGAFEHGGFVLDAGQSLQQAENGNPSAPPILFHYPFPRDWFFVVILPPVPQGLNGVHEDKAFQHLPLPSSECVGRICRLVIMQLLPALLEKDIQVFGQALTEIQRLVGTSFAPVQGSTFAYPILEELIKRLLEAGAHGAGQSSWGPAVYGLVEGEAAARALEDRLRAFLETQRWSQETLGPGPAFGIQSGPLAPPQARIFHAQANNRGHLISIFDETAA